MVVLWGSCLGEVCSVTEILVTLREIKTMDKGLFIGLIVSAGVFIVFLMKDEKKWKDFYKCEIRAFKKLLGVN